MGQIDQLPEWAQHLHKVLAGSERPVNELYTCLDLPQGQGWLADALSGRAQPRTSDYALLSGCSGVPLSVLTGAVPVERSLSVALRAGVLGTAADIEAATRRSQSILDDMRLLTSWFPKERDKREVALTAAKRACSASTSARRAGKLTAERLRDSLGLDDEPINDLVKLVEEFGVPVVREELPSSVHGLTVRDEGLGATRIVVVINSRDYPGRQRYSLAHELCHVLFRDGDSLIVDRAEDMCEINMPEYEYRAETFARHFLATDLAVRRFWHRRVSGAKNDSGQELARFVIEFGTSFQAAVNTLSDVIGLPKEQLRSLAGNGVADLMSRSGYATDWQDACRDWRSPAPSPWLLSMALNAYAVGLVKSSVVANQLDRQDIAALEAELAAEGWAPQNSAASN